MDGEWQPIESAPVRQWVRVRSKHWTEPDWLLGRKSSRHDWWTVKDAEGAFEWTLRGYDPDQWQPIPQPVIKQNP